MAFNGAANIRTNLGFDVTIHGIQGLEAPVDSSRPESQRSREQDLQKDRLRTRAKTDVACGAQESPLADEILVERSLRGDEEAFRLLYERYRLQVYTTMARILRDRIDAQDATQEVFIKVYRALSGWNPGRARFSTWIYRLAANHAIDCWRARRRRAEIGLAEAESAVEAKSQERAKFGAGVCLADRVLEEREKVAGIRRCLRDMSTMQKRIFVLRHVQGLKLREISAIEGYTLGTVKGSLHRAIRLVRQRLRMPEACGQKHLALLAGTASGN